MMPKCGHDPVIPWRISSCLACVFEQLRVYDEALTSIAGNTCCGPCQEAALVAKKALGDSA
jgi:hypothetical protein